MGNPTPGVNAFSAPVFDYSGNIVLAITLMGSSGIFDSSWTGAQAQAIKVCAPMATSNSPTCGHPKFPQARRLDYEVSGLMAMRVAASLRR
jgi:hypothetical protein